MNFELLKIQFKAYLEEINKESGNDYKLNDSEISIFMYADEFKDYITDELNWDYTLYSEDIEDLLRLELINGKLTAPDAEKENEPEEDELDLENQTDINLEDSEIITELLNDLLQDATFKKSIDIDGNGEINDEELTSFFNTIKGFDSNEESISLDDIINATEDIKDGTFKIATPESIKESVEQETPITPGARSGSSGGSTRSQTSGSSTQEKTLDNMTKSELDSELTTAKSELGEKQNILSSLLDGSEENLQAMNENIENLYDTYFEELKKVDEDMATQVDSLEQSISSQEDLINLKDQEIADQEGIVSESETAYNNAVSTKEQLQSSLSELESTDTSNMDDSEIAELNSKISELKSKVSEAEQAEKDAKQTWDDAKTKLDSLNTERESMQTKLDSLNTQMTELEEKIAETYPQVQESLNSYKEAKATRDSYKAEATTAIKSEISTAQSYVDEVKTAINNLDNKEIKKEYSMNQYDAEEGERLVDVARQMLDRYGSSTGYCATGVSRTFAMAYGLSLSGNGCDWDTNMEELVEEGMFVEVTSDYLTSDDLSNLPAGAVVCWEATTGYGGGGAQYGHVTIADGNGGEISDHYSANIYKSIGGSSDNYRVFLPT